MGPPGLAADERTLFAELCAKLRGYYQYYGFRGMFDGLDDFDYRIKRILVRIFNCRSQRRSYNWEALGGLLKVFRV
jgi:RNA-directed DNA polymerase